MSVKLIPLDDSIIKEDSSILFGIGILIKFNPTGFMEDNYPNIRDFINKKDLLRDSEVFKSIRLLIRETDKIAEELDRSVRFKQVLSQYTQKRESSGQIEISDTERTIMDLLGDIKEKIIKSSDLIKEEQDKLKIYFANDHKFYFCKECHSYIDRFPSPVPNLCQGCETTLSREDSEIQIVFLDEDIKDYLNGKWLEDYIARILRNKLDFKTWTSLGVVGTSGVEHEIDVLGVDLESKRVVIIECKHSVDKNEAFKFIAQFSDIQPTSGLYVVNGKSNSPDVNNFFKKKPGVKLLEVQGLTDKEVEKELRDYIFKDN